MNPRSDTLRWVLKRYRAERTGKSWSHYKAALNNSHRILFHLQILPDQPRAAGPMAFTDRLEDVTPPIRASLVAYLGTPPPACHPTPAAGSA